MLEQMRKGAGSWAAKILMVLLVISFGAWGIGDYINRSNAIPPVAKVGRAEISAIEFSDAIRRESTNLQRRLGQALTREQMLQFGLDETVLNGLVAAKLYETNGTKMGLSAAPAVIRDYIMKAEVFRGANGQFDRLRYETFLRNEGYSEAMLVEMVRRDLLREQVLGSLLSGVDTLPNTAVDAVLTYRLETRVADYIRIEAAKLPAPAAPTDAEIEEFYKANPALYTAPERRDIAYISLTPQGLTAAMPVSDAEIAEDYESHKGDFVRPETRHVQQVVFQNEDDAKAAAEAVIKGEDFVAMAARTRQLKPADIELGTVAQGQLPAELAAPVFALPQPGLTQPVRSAFGWHLARVVAIQPGSTVPLAETSPRLKQEIALRKASEALLKLRPQVDDLIAGGGSLAEIAKAQNTALVSLTGLDATGLDATGKTAELPATQPAMLQEAFALAEDADPIILDSSDGSFHVLDVVAVKPSALRPLADVLPEVIRSIETRRRAEAALQRANQVAERLRVSGELLKEATAMNVLVQTTPPLARSGQPADRALSPALVSQLFAAKQPGEIVVGPGSAPGDVIVARLGRIVPADLAAVAAQRDTTRQQLAQGVVADLEERYRAKLQSEIGVSVNAAARARAMLQ